jgi:PII-like signaling protein
LVRLSKDLPVLIEMIDTAERIQEILPVIDPMVTKGLIAQENINVIAYRHQE